MTDDKKDLKFPGMIPIRCSGDCGWDVLVDVTDPRLPDGPFTCGTCDPSCNKPCSVAGCEIATQHGHPVEWDSAGNVIALTLCGPSISN